MLVDIQNSFMYPIYLQDVIHYMYYALSAYGWPMFLMTHSKTGMCQLCTKVRCCCFSYCRSTKETADIIEDNCCYCNYAAMKKMLSITEAEVIYTTYHVDVAETPFFVAIDYTKQKIVVSIRGTLSMQDVLTDLNAEGEVLPLEPRRDDWVGHKGMVQAAVYIRSKLDEERLLQRAQMHNIERKTDQFGLVIVGHSLGAGTAAILSILLKPHYPTLLCYSYSPPGGKYLIIFLYILCNSNDTSSFLKYAYSETTTKKSYYCLRFLFSSMSYFYTIFLISCHYYFPCALLPLVSLYICGLVSGLLR